MADATGNPEEGPNRRLHEWVKRRPVLACSVFVSVAVILFLLITSLWPSGWTQRDLDGFAGQPVEAVIIRFGEPDDILGGGIFPDEATYMYDDRIPNRAGGKYRRVFFSVRTRTVVRCMIVEK